MVFQSRGDAETLENNFALWNKCVLCKWVDVHMKVQIENCIVMSNKGEIPATYGVAWGPQ